MERTEDIEKWSIIVQENDSERTAKHIDEILPGEYMASIQPEYHMHGFNSLQTTANPLR